MFTMADVDDLHARLGRAETLADYVRGLAALGVVRAESFVADGHTEYVAADGSRLTSPPHHDTYPVAATPDRPAVLEHLRRHAAHETGYAEMSAALAAAGVEKWVIDTGALTLTYRDRAGTALHVDHLARPDGGA